MWTLKKVIVVKPFLVVDQLQLILNVFLLSDELGIEGCIKCTSCHNKCPFIFYIISQ